MITLWHNQRCSKSRQALALLQAAGAEFTLRKYLDDAPTRSELDAVLMALRLAPIGMIRKGETLFKTLNLSPQSDPETLMQAMTDHPILIERPIAIRGSRAVIGRPPEAIKALL